MQPDSEMMVKVTCPRCGYPRRYCFGTFWASCDACGGLFLVYAEDWTASVAALLPWWGEELPEDTLVWVRWDRSKLPKVGICGARARGPDVLRYGAARRLDGVQILSYAGQV